MLIDPNTSIHDVTWYVCAPGSKPSNGTLSVESDFTTRSGVELKVTPRSDIGCAEITANQTADYTPLPIERHDCELDWEQLNVQAGLALQQPGIDVRKAIEKLVPKSIISKVERNPIIDCYDPLQAPPLGTSGKPVVDDDQPYPFYGRVAVSWKQ
jgi:hypothetical protein